MLLDRRRGWVCKSMQVVGGSEDVAAPPGDGARLQRGRCSFPRLGIVVLEEGQGKWQRRRARGSTGGWMGSRDGAVKVGGRRGEKGRVIEERRSFLPSRGHRLDHDDDDHHHQPSSSPSSLTRPRPRSAQGEHRHNCFLSSCAASTKAIHMARERLTPRQGQLPIIDDAPQGRQPATTASSIRKSARPNGEHANTQSTVCSDSKADSANKPVANGAHSSSSSAAPKVKLKVQTSQLATKIPGPAAGPRSANAPVAPLSVLVKGRPRASTVSAAAANGASSAAQSPSTPDDDGSTPSSARSTIAPSPLSGRRKSLHGDGHPRSITSSLNKKKNGSASPQWRVSSQGNLTNVSTAPDTTTPKTPATLSSRPIEKTASQSGHQEQEGTAMSPEMPSSDAQSSLEKPAQDSGRADGSPIANRPKSKTITGLAPQLLRAQRAAAEAAQANHGVVSRLSDLHINSCTDTDELDNRSNADGGAENSVASYSSTDTVFSPVLPPSGSSLRSSRNREPISRRMTISSDLRPRLDSRAKLQDERPTSPTVEESDVHAQADGEEDLRESPSTPKAHDQIEKPPPRTRDDECELCGALTTALTALQPCGHYACAACCSSGINQVSSKPPRDHICAACRSPVKSISVPKLVFHATPMPPMLPPYGLHNAVPQMYGYPAPMPTFVAPAGGQISGHSGLPMSSFNSLRASPTSSAVQVPTSAFAMTPMGVSHQLQSPYEGRTAVPWTHPVEVAHGPSGWQSNGLVAPQYAAEQPSALLPSVSPQWESGSPTGCVPNGEASDGGVSQCAVVRVDNIPWTVGCDDIMKWLPDPAFTLAPRSLFAQAVHIPIDLQSGKTSNACFLVCRDRKAAQRIVRARTNTKLCGRAVTLILSTFHELLDEVFTTRNLSASLDEDRAVHFTEQQLDRLLSLLKEGGGQLKDGGKPIEFASSLMTLVPRRLEESQREMLFNVVNDMVNHCLAVVAHVPSIRPALDRLLLSCSMCAAFTSDQKLVIIEAARAALSALMASERSQRRLSPRARKPASLTLATADGVARQGVGQASSAINPPSPYASHTPLPTPGLVATMPLPQHSLKGPMHGGALPGYTPVPYGTPPYLAQDLATLQAPSLTSVDAAGKTAAATSVNQAADSPYGSSYDVPSMPASAPIPVAPAHGARYMLPMVTPECSPAEPFKSSSGMVMDASNACAQFPGTPVTPYGAPPQLPLGLHVAHSSRPPSYGTHIGMAPPQVLPGFLPGPMGPLLPPYGYVPGASPTRPTAQAPQFQANGWSGSPASLTGAQLALDGNAAHAMGAYQPNVLGLYQQAGVQPSSPTNTCNGQSSSMVPPVAPAYGQLDSSGSQAPVHSAATSAGNGAVITTLDEVKVNGQGQAQGKDGLLPVSEADPAGSQDEDTKFDRLVDAVAQAIGKKKHASPS